MGIQMFGHFEISKVFLVSPDAKWMLGSLQSVASFLQSHCHCQQLPVLRGKGVEKRKPMDGFFLLCFERGYLKHPRYLIRSSCLCNELLSRVGLNEYCCCSKRFFEGCQGFLHRFIPLVYSLGKVSRVRSG